MKQLDVLPFVFAADIVFFACLSVVHNLPDGAVVVFYINPVADIKPFAVNRKIFSVADIAYHKRKQFFRELIRTVVVRTVRKRNR